jgi:hypothetical protein
MRKFTFFILIFIGLTIGTTVQVFADGSATSNSDTKSSTNIQVQQSNTKPKVVIFPNPTSGLVTVRVEYETRNISIQLFCQNGRCVLNKKLHAPADNLLDVRNLEAGVYMYNILKNYKKIEAGKLIISK